MQAIGVVSLLCHGNSLWCALESGPVLLYRFEPLMLEMMPPYQVPGRPGRAPALR